MNKIIIISGPSGVGEDAVIEGLRKKLKFNRVITTVTRAKRPGETEGHPYYFISPAKFQTLLKQKAFVESARVYNNWRGCTKKEVARLLKLPQPIIFKVDWQGVKTIKKLYPGSLAIFLRPTSYRSLEKRLINRGKDKLTTIQERKNFTLDWLQQKSAYDFAVVNRDGHLAATIDRVHRIIKKHLE
ncbi:MAG: guanylate kinase [Patescibacteria group bacterium]|jgi:guanylate kinase